MKQLIVAQYIHFFRSLDNVLRELGRRGHEVIFLHGTQLDPVKIAKKRDVQHQNERWKQKRSRFGRGLQVVESEVPGVTSGYRPPLDSPCGGIVGSVSKALGWLGACGGAPAQ